MERFIKKRTGQTKTDDQSSRLSETQTSQSHEPFRGSDEFFRLVVESLEGYAVFTTDKEGLVSSWNTGAEKLLGYSEQEIMGQESALIFTPEDRAKGVPRQEREKAASEGRSTDERPHMKKDGTTFWGSGLVFPLLNEDKTILGFTKILRDMTEQKRSQQLIADARLYAESIVDTIREPLLVLNNDLCVVSANRAFYLAFHVTRAETEKHYVYELGNGQWDIPALRTLFEDILSSNTSFDNYQVEHDFPALGKRIMLLNARKLYREQNHMEMILLAIEDITERKQLEQFKEDFTRIASHELKTPVTSIKGFTQLLHRNAVKQGDEQAVHMLSRMDKQLDILTLLINDMLDVARVQTGKLSLQNERFDLRTLVNEIAEDVQATTSTHHIVLEGRDSAFVYGDRDRVGQVLVNLLTNAVKYSPQGDKVIVSLETDEQVVTVRVQDFGIGIAAAYHQRVFEQFYQVGNTTTSTGLGLGLYISHEIIKQHQGRMWLESSEGKGSIFYFTLPLAGEEGV